MRSYCLSTKMRFALLLAYYLVLSPSCASLHIGRRSPSIPLCPPPDRSPPSTSYPCIGCLHVGLYTCRLYCIVSCQFPRSLPLLHFPSELQSMACTARLSPSILVTCPIQRSLQI